MWCFRKSFNKTWLKISFSFNLGLLRITSETKINFIFGFLLKFYMKLTSMLEFLSLLFRSTSFGKHRLSSWIGRKLVSVISNRIKLSNSTFGNLRAYGSNRVISAIGSRDVAKPLKISCFRVDIGCVDSMYTSFKQKKRTLLSLPFHEL